MGTGLHGLKAPDSFENILAVLDARSADAGDIHAG
jgi:hypothetical protein